MTLPHREVLQAPLTVFVLALTEGNASKKYSHQTGLDFDPLKGHFLSNYLNHIYHTLSMLMPLPALVNFMSERVLTCLLWVNRHKADDDICVFIYLFIYYI